MTMAKKSGRFERLSFGLYAMDDATHKHSPLFWAGIAAGVAFGVAAVIYIVRQTDPPHRMDRILRRCESRIDNIESSLADLESTLIQPIPER